MKLSEDALNNKISSYAKKMGARDVNKIRASVALARIVARLKASEYLKDKIVFCGGFVLYKEQFTERYTRDVDLIAGAIDHKRIVLEVKKAIEKNIGDGFWFGDILIEEIQDDIGYGGIRFKPRYKVGTPFPETHDDLRRLRRLHVDLSFQQITDDMKQVSSFSDELGLYENIIWDIYPIEFIAADKLHATIVRAGLSTRSKDIYDLSKILYECKKTKLTAAIEHIFTTRGDKLEGTVLKCLRSLQTDSLKANWKKIENFTGDESFEECWKMIIRYFETTSPLP